MQTWILLVQRELAAGSRCSGDAAGQKQRSSFKKLGINSSGGTHVGSNVRNFDENV